MDYVAVIAGDIGKARDAPGDIVCIKDYCDVITIRDLLAERRGYPGIVGGPPVP